MKILIIGGYGTFGGRIVQLLKNNIKLTLIVAGRSIAKAQEFCSAHSDSQAQLVAAFFDRGVNVQAQFQALKPDWVIDASGPFQNYGAQSYSVVEACIACKMNYLDLADGSSFVTGVSAFDQSAKEAGVFILSGVSSFPVLTAAVVRHLQKHVITIETIYAGIAPSPYAGVGLNVIKAIAGYAGQPTQIKREGRRVIAYPFTEYRYVTIAPPGHKPLRHLRFSLVDVPDLQVLVEQWPNAQTVWMGAGPVPYILHRALNLLSWFVRWRLLPSALPLAPIISWVTNHIRWGEHRGGMFVQVSGQDQDSLPCTLEWHLLAEGDDGPLIPSMAVQALVLRALNGQQPMTGARAAVNDLEISDYAPLFAARQLFTGLRRTEFVNSQAKPMGVFQTILGSAFDQLALPIQRFHSVDADANLQFEGLCDVEGATGLIGKLIARVIDFPKSGRQMPINVTVESRVNKQGASIELWTRTVGQSAFCSQLFAGSGESSHLLCERFGPTRFAIALIREDSTLRWEVRHWTLFGIRMPLWLAPRSDATETVVDNNFYFAVKLSHPLVGRIVHYQGWLRAKN